jgi:SprT protein
VLCHELAHLAVHRLHGRSAKPHGPEWRALMQAAGYPPVTSLCRVVTDQSADRRLSPSQFEHRCPVCQMVRLARRRVSAWRCANCVAAGLPGELIVTRQEGRSPR